jgi:hypothetical protein
MRVLFDQWIKFAVVSSEFAASTAISRVSTDERYGKVTTLCVLAAWIPGIRFRT